MRLKSPDYFLALVVLFSFSINIFAAGNVNEKSQVSAKESFVLTAIYFNKVNLLDSFEFFPFYEEYLGARVTVSTLTNICEKISNLYNEKGFLSARCELPPQSIVKGVAKFRVIEGVIGKVSLAGDAKVDDSLLNAYIEKITIGQPLNEEQLSGVVANINALGGVDVSTYTRPIESSQELELVFEIEQLDYSGEIYINNRGSKVVGPVQIGAEITAYSLLGLHEYLRLSYMTTSDAEELNYVELNTAWPVGDAGSTLLFESSYTDSVPGDFLEELEIDVNVSAVRFGWAKPVVRNKNETLIFTLLLDYLRSDTSFFDSRVALDEIYKFKIEMDYIYDSSRHYFKTNFSVSHGLPDLNTTEVNSNGLVSTGREDFEILSFDMYYRILLQKNFLLAFQAQGQYAFTDLPISEQIVFGNEVMGSAYDPAEFFGDHGVGGKSRLIYQLDNSLISSGYTQLYSQYDIVKTWNNDLNVNVSGASFGLGVSLGSNAFNVDFQLAKPLTKSVLLEGNNDVRFFGNMRMYF